jgi:hypothetical protein
MKSCPTNGANGTTTGSKMFVIYRCAFKLLLSKTTSSVAMSKDIPIHTIIDPPPKLSLVTKLHCAYHSPGRLYTNTCPSDSYRQNLDSLKTKTLRQSCSTQLSNAKFKQALRRAALNLGPVAGLLGCIRSSFSRFLTVFSLRRNAYCLTCDLKK